MAETPNVPIDVFNNDLLDEHSACIYGRKESALLAGKTSVPRNALFRNNKDGINRTRKSITISTYQMDNDPVLD